MELCQSYLLCFWYAFSLLFPCMPRHLDERKNGRRLLNFEPLNPAGGRNPHEVAILEEKYIFVHINSR